MPSVIPTGFMDGTQAFIPAGDSPPDQVTGGAISASAKVVDGTPARVAAIAILATAVLVGMRWAGIKFNVAVST